ncbi:MAG: hypothetical protein HQK95_05710 [Nitrospirae bacterium]|nr:hypothetical protein [Nitrospirota bacterium]
MTEDTETQDKRNRWAEGVTNDKYLLLMSCILTIENRLLWSELAYLSLNLCIILFSMGLLSYASGMADTHVPYMSAIFLAVIGEFICVYWLISSMKHQMKLRLRYFQARYLERKQGMCGESFISDESNYFNPSVGYVESPDKVERVDYPSRGATRMDGFAGSAKPRHLTWLMSSVIFFMYVAILLWVYNDMFKLY